MIIVKENLSAIERKEFDDGWQHNAFNQFISDRVSMHRALPDVRDAESVFFFLQSLIGFRIMTHWISFIA